MEYDIRNIQRNLILEMECIYLSAKRTKIYLLTLTSQKILLGEGFQPFKPVI